MDYNERVLRVTAFNLTPWVSVDPYFQSLKNNTWDNHSEKTLPFHGPLAIFLEYLRDSLKLRLLFVPNVNASQGHGRMAPNTQWNGAIGMILRKEVDLALIPAGLSFDRYQVTFMPQPLAYTTTAILSRYTSPQAGSAMYFLTMFPKEVWCILAMSALFVATMVYFFEQKLTHLIKIKDRQVISYKEYVWQIFATLFSEYISIQIRSTQGRTMVSCWLLLIVVIINVINGSKKATLMTNEKSNVETLNDLFNIPSLAPIMMKDSIFTRYFKIPSESVYSTLIREKLLERATKRQTLVTSDAIASYETYQDVFNRRGVILNDYFQTMRGLVSYCTDDKVGEFYRAEKHFFEIPASLLFSRNLTHLYESITLSVLYVKENGLMDYWLLKTLGNNYEKCLNHGSASNSDESNFYGMQEIAPVFSSVFRGFVFGFVLIAMEICVNHHLLKRKRKRPNRIKPTEMVFVSRSNDPNKVKPSVTNKVFKSQQQLIKVKPKVNLNLDTPEMDTTRITFRRTEVKTSSISAIYQPGSTINKPEVLSRKQKPSTKY